MKRVLITSLLLIVALAAGLFLFLGSGNFLTLIEDIASHRLSQPVSIGSIHLKKGNRIIVRDVTITAKEKGGPRIVLPETEIVLSFAGMKKRMVDELTIVRPELTLTLQAKKQEAPEMDEISLPVDFQRMSIREGTVIIRAVDKIDIAINDIQLSLQWQAKEMSSRLKASARIPGFISKVNAEASVDVRRMNVSEAKVDLGEADLSALYSETGLGIPDTWVQGTADISLSMKEDDGGGVRWSEAVSVKDFALHSGSVDVTPRGGLFKLESGGTFISDNGDVEINKCQIQIGGLSPWQLSGRLGNIFSGNPEILLALSTGDTALHEAVEIISGPAVRQLQSIDFRAKGALKLGVSGSLRAPAFSADAHIKGDYLNTNSIRLEGFEAVFPVKYKDNRLTINASSVKIIEGSLFEDQKELSLRINGLEVKIPGLAYNQGSVRSVFFQVNTDNAVVYRGGSELFSESGIVLKGIANADIDGSFVELKDLSLDGSSIKGVSGEVSIIRDRSPAIEASVSWKDIDINSAGQKVLSSMMKEKGLSIHGIGSFHTAFAMSETEKGTSKVSGSIQASFADAGFSSADETRIGEGIKGELKGSYEIPLPADRIDFSVQSHVTGFELLSGKFYGDFTNKIISLSGEGSYTESLRTLIVSRSEAGLSGVGKVFFTGNVTLNNKLPFIDGEIRITDISNSEAFNFLLRETYKERFPFLSEFEVNGNTSAGFHVNGSPERFTVKGNLDIRDTNIMGKQEKSSIRGIQISLPVDLSYPEAGKPALDRSYGFVRVRELSLGFIQLNDIQLFPAIQQNVLTLKEDAGIKLFGGDITFRDVSYNDILSPERRLHLALNINDMSLEEACAALDVPGFSGTLSGTIPRAVFSKGKLITEGEVLLELFGGRVRIGDLSVDNVLSPVASIKSGIEIDDINLGKLTAAFDFGHISGVISGSIKDLVVVNGQAQSFNAQLATVRKKGINQRISVDALKKISILGTGTSTSILDKGIYRFLKKYRYQKIGFNASLNNDNLVLLGLDSRDNVGYLVKGGLFPPKVDVINYTQNVSFKEMVKRLKRIGQVNR